VVDWESQRASVFSVDDGEVVADFPVPPLFRPVAPMAEATLLGLYEDMRPLGGALAEVDTTGSRLRDLVLAGPIESDTDGVGFARGLLVDSAELAIQIQGSRFGVYSTQGELLSTFSSPFDADRPRPERDVEEYAESRGSMFGAPSPAQIEEYRRRPPPPIVRETNLRIGPDGTLWMATRQGDGHSYLAVFRRDQLVAELEVRHRLLGFDIWEDRLVTLVERPHRDDEGLYVRGLDYYRIQSHHRFHL
jgi:hypothetical protein